VRLPFGEGGRADERSGESVGIDATVRGCFPTIDSGDQGQAGRNFESLPGRLRTANWQVLSVA
jgi:hypothetical protein